ncbi:MAG TPA: hypothetical protein VJQ57_09335 [Acidimicrobiia bacterium]|nr:hypothetical protein [Acidimicrobiia bacterium]
MTTRIGSFRIGSEAIAGTYARAKPTVALTAPGTTVSASTVTATWTYTTTVSRAQTHYRVRIYTSDGGTTLFDSGTVSGAGTSSNPSYLLSSLSTYMLGLSAFDGHDWSDEDTTLFTVELEDVVDYPDVDNVGAIYEIGINGTGYMLSDQPGGEYRYRRQTIPLDAPRFAQGDTPFTQAVERYTFMGSADFSGGAGQKWLNRGSSDTSKFWQSEGVNPFEPGELTLLNATDQTLADTYTAQNAVVLGSDLYVQTANAELTKQSTPGGATTAFTITAAGTISSMTTDGTYWYACDGANIFRKVDAADVAAWSTENAKLIAYAGDRICMADATSGSAPNRFSTLTDAGAVEVNRLTLAVGTTISSICGGDGYVWFSAYRGNTGAVYAWQAGTSDTPFNVFELPVGQVPTAVAFYQGNLFIRASETLASGSRAVIWRGPVSDGRPSPEVVLEIEEAGVAHGPGAFCGDDRFIHFSWRDMTSGGRSGVGAIDLSTGGWAKWLYADDDTASGHVRSIVNWNGLVAFTVDGYGAVVDDEAPLTTGWLRTSHSDLATSLTKVFDEVDVVFEPLPNNGSVSVEYSVDAGGSYQTISGATVSSAGSKTLHAEVAVQGASLGLEITLGAVATSPSVSTITAKVHPIGLADQLLTLPVNCADRLVGLNRVEIAEQCGPGFGYARARTLESLAQTRVRFQDVDWWNTGTATIWEVIGVEVVETGPGVMDPHQNARTASLVAVLTMRRALR